MKLGVCLGVLAVVLGGSRQAAAQQETAQNDTTKPRGTFATGVIGASTFHNGFGDVPMLLSLGWTFSYAPRSFYAFGGEVAAFELAFNRDEDRQSCPTCASAGTMFLPFGELRTPWKAPVNVFARLSIGLAVANANDGSRKALALVRAAAGPELRVWHVYFKPFVSVANKVSAEQGDIVGFGAEIGAVF
jgi:hypothetical protein